MQRNLSNLQQCVPRKPGETHYWCAGLGGRSDLQRNQRTLGKHCIASCWMGVTLCNGGCKLLRLLRKVELDSTLCSIARNNKRCIASCRGTVTPHNFYSNLQRNGVALQVAGKIAWCNRALRMEIFPV